MIFIIDKIKKLTFLKNYFLGIIFIHLLISSSCINNYQVGNNKKVFVSRFKWNDSLNCIDNYNAFQFDEKAYYRKELIPDSFIEEVEKYLTESNLKTFSVDDKKIAIDYLANNPIGEVYKWKIKDKNLEFFFFSFNNLILGEGIYVFASKNNKFSKKPFIYKNYMDESHFEQSNRWLDKPLIDYRDLNQDNVEELMLKERLHNGNVYDAVMTNYLNIDEHLNILPLVHIESIARINDFEDGYIVRQSEFLPMGNIKVVSVIKTYKKGNIIDSIGEIEIETKPLLRIKKVRIKNKKFKKLLFTASGLKNDSVLRDGYK